MFKRRFISGIIISAIALSTIFALPVWGQLPFLPKINLETFKLKSNTTEVLISGCVRLDGLCVFEILDQKENLAQRIKFTEQRLKDISHTYFKSKSENLSVVHEEKGNQQSIYVAVDSRRIPVLTMNNQDAARRGVYLEHEAERVAAQIERGLRQAKQQRSAPFLIRQGKMAGSVFLLMVLASLVNSNWSRRSQRQKAQIAKHVAETISSQLDHKKKVNLQEVKYRLLQFLQFSIWAGGIIVILGLFPQTRTAQLWIITLIRIPLRIILVS
ncbi:MAG: mechanosensitive ion channel family protein, partial [Cyanobacteria bacterium J06600_6]